MGFTNLRLGEIAQRLNVSLQTLYNHVKDRDELLHLAAEVLEQADPKAMIEDCSWEQWWRSRARVLLEQYRRTPGLATILMNRPLSNAPPLIEQWEVAQVMAEREGFEPLKALWANLAVHEFVYAWASREEQGRNPERLAGPQAVPSGDFKELAPRFSYAFALAMSEPYEARFEFSLNAMLAGLRQGIGGDPDLG
ncbi:TetR/AcrR family transcriptional regulator C-terminal domain-containing protein [Croceibacterium salegens]|nr:TetR/AcrR family transcriptional regulator C-terminal domain-containing protein [Croceibacterium salegens]